VIVASTGPVGGTLAGTDVAIGSADSVGGVGERTSQ
jgi:hypothetical protein